MITTDDYIKFVSNPILPAENKDEDLWFLFKDKMILIKSDKEKIQIPRFNDVKGIIDGLEIKYNLGKLMNIQCFCGEINSAVEVSGKFKFIALRKVTAIIDKEYAAVAGKAAQIIHFHKVSKYCGICGGKNEFVKSEFAMKCKECGYIVYPKVCPAIIVGITKGDKILLANNKNFPKGLHSVIAGFVDVNETLEECVKREILEEVNIKVKNIKYFDSQPWPYPNSLMIGFTAEYESGEIKVDGEEIIHADWYNKDELPMLPEKTTIARRIIDSILYK